MSKIFRKEDPIPIVKFSTKLEWAAGIDMLIYEEHKELAFKISKEIEEHVKDYINTKLGDMKRRLGI